MGASIQIASGPWTEAEIYEVTGAGWDYLVLLDGSEVSSKHTADEALAELRGRLLELVSAVDALRAQKAGT